MRKQLRDLIDQLEYWEQVEIFQCLNVAQLARSITTKFEITHSSFANFMDLSEEDATKFLKGTYPYDLRVISKLEALKVHLESMKIEEKGAYPTINFPEYKDGPKSENQQQNE